MKFLIGYEIPTGAPVEAEMHHLFISGITRHSGKTTSLEAFLSRLDVAIQSHVVKDMALVFRCGRGEIGFDDATSAKPYFAERTDWRFVEGMLSAHLKEKVKFYRGDIMRACRGAHSLADVHANVRTSLKKAREGTFVQKIYTELDQYFAEALPELAKIDFADELRLQEGVNVVDLVDVPTATQQLIIAASIDRIMEKMVGVTLVVPEAWEMVPQDRASPVKLAAETMARKGAKIGNYLWLDSQQMTGMEMDILRNVDIWMFGRQTLDLEKERVAKQIPGRKVRADDVAALEVGQFYLVRYGKEVQKVYVRPAWLDEHVAAAVARGELQAEKAAAGYRIHGVNALDRALKEEYEKKIAALEEDRTKLRLAVSDWKAELENERKKVAGLEKFVADMGKPGFRIQTWQGAPLPEDNVEAAAEHIGPSGLIDIDTLALKVADMLRTKAVDLILTKEESALEVVTRRETVEADESTIRGRIGILLADGFFGTPRLPNHVIQEGNARGWKWSAGGNRVAMYRELRWFCEAGFLRLEDKSYVALPGIAKRVKVREAE